MRELVVQTEAYSASTEVAGTAACPGASLCSSDGRGQMEAGCAQICFGRG